LDLFERLELAADGTGREVARYSPWNGAVWQIEFFDGPRFDPLGVLLLLFYFCLFVCNFGLGVEVMELAKWDGMGREEVEKLCS